MPKKNAMTPAAANRIKSANAKNGDGTTQKGSFAARAEAAAAKNSNSKGK